MSQVTTDYRQFLVHETPILAIPIRIYPEDGGYVAYGENLPGLVSEGDTYEETLDNISDATKAIVESYRESGEPIPWADTSEFYGEPHKGTLIRVTIE